jgi:hypothetical protein
MSKEIKRAESKIKTLKNFLAILREAKRKSPKGYSHVVGMSIGLVDQYIDDLKEEIRDEKNFDRYLRKRKLEEKTPWVKESCKTQTKNRKQ